MENNSYIYLQILMLLFQWKLLSFRNKELLSIYLKKCKLSNASFLLGLYQQKSFAFLTIALK